MKVVWAQKIYILLMWKNCLFSPYCWENCLYLGCWACFCSYICTCSLRCIVGRYDSFHNLLFLSSSASIVFGPLQPPRYSDEGSCNIFNTVHGGTLSKKYRFDLGFSWKINCCDHKDVTCSLNIRYSYFQSEAYFKILRLFKKKSIHDIIFSSSQEYLMGLIWDHYFFHFTFVA